MQKLDDQSTIFMNPITMMLQQQSEESDGPAHKPNHSQEKHLMNCALFFNS